MRSVCINKDAGIYELWDKKFLVGRFKITRRKGWDEHRLLSPILKFVDVRRGK